MFSWAKGKELSYVTFALGMIVAVGGALGYIPDTVMITLLSVFGFSGLAGLRAFLDSTGWKTYAVAIVGIAATVLNSLGYVTADQMYLIIGILVPAGGGTLMQGISKSQNKK